MTASAQGIDISSFQSVYSASQLKQYDFAFFRATLGTTDTDAHFAANWRNARSAGIHRGAYHELTVTSAVSTQTQHFISTVKTQGVQAGDMMAVVSSDYAGVTGAGVKSWCDTVKAAFPACIVLVYSDLAVLPDLGQCTGYPLWIAYYSGSAPKSVKPWARWTFWQWTGTTLDKDAFNGDKAALDAFIGKPAPAVKPGIPTDGTTTGITPTSAVIRYTGVPGGVKYDVQVTEGGTASGKQVFRESVGGSSGSGVAVTGLQPATRYGWRIAAYNSAGANSGWSGFIPFTTIPDPAKWSYPAPGGLGIGQGTATIPVSWKPVAHGGGNAPSYTLQILDSAGRVFASYTVHGTSQTVTVPRGTYTARVWAEGGPAAPPHTDLKFTV